MPNVTANNIQIEYQTFGDKSDPAIILISGYGQQMVMWSEDFCQQLAGKGHFVIIFDNRDVGLTQKFFEDCGGVKLLEELGKMQNGEEFDAPYSYDDMSDDVVGLLDALDIEKAHIGGFSMGGGIAQNTALRHPTRTLSLISMGFGTGEGDKESDPSVSHIFTIPEPDNRNDYKDYFEEFCRLCSGLEELSESNKEIARELGGLYFDRCYYPQGKVSQGLGASKKKRTKEMLKSVSVPTLVLHGEIDPLVPVENGIAVHENIPGSELHIIKGMGHVPFPDFIPEMIDAISNHARKVDSKS